jgi:hypothetical protein
MFEVSSDARSSSDIARGGAADVPKFPKRAFSCSTTCKRTRFCVLRVRVFLLKERTCSCDIRPMNVARMRDNDISFAMARIRIR